MLIKTEAMVNVRDLNRHKFIDVGTWKIQIVAVKTGRVNLEKSRPPSPAMEIGISQKKSQKVFKMEIFEALC